MKFKYFLFLSLCLLTMNIAKVKSQSLNISERFESDIPVCKVDSVIHIVHGCNAMFDIEFVTFDSIVNILQFEYEFNDVSGNIEYQLDEGVVTDVMPIILDNIDPTETTQLHVVLKYVKSTLTENKKEQGIIGDTVTIIRDSAPIHVWQNPSCEIEEPQLYSDVVSGDSLLFNAIANGGNNAGWTIQWEEDGQTIANVADFTYYCNTNVDKSEKMLRVAIINYAPDGVTIWYQQNKEYAINIWALPLVEVVSPTNFVYQTHTGELNWTIKPNGGNIDGWVITWPDGSHELTYSTSFVNMTDNLISKDIVVSVFNYSPDGITKLYKDSIEYHIDIYPTSQVNNLSKEEWFIYDGETIKLQVTATNGYDNGWSYRWVDSSNKVLGTNSTLDYTAAIIQGSELHQKITVICTNTAILSDGTQEKWCNQTFEYLINVYKEPMVSFAAEYPENISDGDTILLKLNIIGGDESSWKYEWKINDQSISGDSYYCYVGHNPDNDNGTTDKIAVTMYNQPKDSQKFFTKTLRLNVVTWPKPSIVYPEEFITVHDLTDDQKLSLKINVSGGYKYGWIYQWYLNDDPFENVYQTTYETKTINKTNMPKTDEYKVVCRNICNGQELLNETYQFKVNIWPVPNVTLKCDNFDAYYGDTIEFVVDTLGGYTGANDNWQFTWNVSSGIDNKNRYYYPVDESGVDNYQNNYSVNVKNLYSDGTIWYETNLPIHVNAWSRGFVAPNALDSVDVYSGRNVDLTPIVSGGYNGEQGGWTYTWTDNGNVLNVSSSNLTFTAMNSNNVNNQYQHHKYILTAQNSIGDNRGSIHQIEYNINIWPTCVFPSAINIYDNTNSMDVMNSIREGNAITLSVDSAYCGYWPETGDNWEYIWTVNSKAIQESPIYNTNVGMSSTSDKKSVEKRLYQLAINNYGPTGQVWDSKRYEKEVNVYRRPKTPIQLSKKGNGSSCTLIANSTYNDIQLDDFDYYLVFGYTDANGMEHKKDPIRQIEGITRFDKFSNSEFNDSNNKFWVYSLWMYEDGSKVTSGKCYLDGHLDEIFDGSIYGESTRGIQDETTLIHDANSQHNVIINSDYIKGYSDKMDDVKICIYNLQGQCVYENHSQVYGGFEYEYSLVSGIYIVRVECGDQTIIKKVIVK